MGRPPTKPVKRKDGFYFEVRNKGAQSGIKIRRETKEDMLRGIEEYARSKEIVILGESKNGKFIDKK